MPNGLKRNKVEFDPEGEGYDEVIGEELRTMYPLNIPKPSKYEGDYINEDGAFQAWVWHPELNDYLAHSGSLDPRTGMVLKGQNHPTYHLTKETEDKLGNTIIKRGNRYYSVPMGIRPKEDAYFRQRPDVTGMATPDGRVIVNPNSNLTDQERQSVVANETARLAMRSGMITRPQFTLTPTQNDYFATYSPNIQDVRETIAARILSGDESAQDYTPEQMNYVKGLGIRLKGKRGR